VDSNLLAMQSDEMVPGTTTPINPFFFFCSQARFAPSHLIRDKEGLCARGIEWCWPYRKPPSADKNPRPKVPISGSRKEGIATKKKQAHQRTSQHRPTTVHADQARTAQVSRR
jgi:hypothetical protein